MSYEIVKGADLSAINHEGKTPIDLSEHGSDLRARLEKAALQLEIQRAGAATREVSPAARSRSV